MDFLFIGIIEAFKIKIIKNWIEAIYD